MLPDMPLVAAPDEITIAPLAPELVVPDAKRRDPLIPTLPAFTVRIATEPLLVGTPLPVDKDTEPPVSVAATPAEA
jgi:hypothetical protein